MSNTFIGLKQADGSFYPILRDGIAENKQISLTTVRDDQSAVKINLYKKDIDSLDEPEYVDTLLIENLIPHPKTEPTINLNVNLDENNILTAEVSDPETGNKSDIKVSMVTLPKEELGSDPDFALSDSERPSLSSETSPTEDSDFNLPADMSFDMPDMDFPEDTAAESSESQEDSLTPDDFSFDSSEDLSFDMETPASDDTTAQEAMSDLPENTDTPEDASLSDFDLGDLDIPDFDSDTADKTSAEDLSSDIPEPDTNTTDETSAEDLSFDMPEPESSEMSFDMPDDLNIDLPDPDSAKTADTEATDTAGEDLSFDMPEPKPSEMSFDMPDFGEEDAFASSGSDELGSNNAPLGDDDFTPAADSGSEDLNLDIGDDTGSSMSFDMPDIDNFSADTEEKATEDITPSFEMSDSDMSFDMPDDNTSFNMPDEEAGFDTANTTSFDTEDGSSFAMPAAQPDFDDGFDDKPEKPQKKKFGFGRKKQAAFSGEMPPLYDQDLPDNIDDDSCNKKKCRIAVAVCIICAILCILAVIAIFLLFPWKKDAPPQAENIVTVEPPSQLQMQPPPEEPAKPEENTIVIIEKETVENREVVPEKAEPAPEAKPQAVRYRIKWGDTLWDLSDTYYRNPWLYPIIARENKIKNPDVIIAGTYIMIPPR